MVIGISLTLLAPEPEVTLDNNSSLRAGLIAKTFGLTAALIGLFIGGAVVYSLGVFRSLWVFGIMQALSTGLFALIAFTGPEKWALAVTVLFEDISAGMGSTAFITYLAIVTNKKYSGTQYAILSSIATLGKNFLSGFSGDMAASTLAGYRSSTPAAPLQSREW